MFAMSTLVGTPVVAPVKAVRAVRSTRVVAAGTKTVSKPKANWAGKCVRVRERVSE